MLTMGQNWRGHILYWTSCLRSIQGRVVQTGLGSPRVSAKFKIIIILFVCNLMIGYAEKNRHPKNWGFSA